MKRQWGFDHITTKKTKQRASADIGLIFIAYNLKRIWNIVKAIKRPYFHFFNSILVLLKTLYSFLQTFLKPKTNNQLLIPV
jgi:hypothetical protein